MSKEKINSKDPVYNLAFMAFTQVQSKVYSSTLSEDEIKEFKEEFKTEVQDFIEAGEAGFLSDDAISLFNDIMSFIGKEV